MKRTGKRMLSWLLAVVMVLSMLPVTALAADETLPKGTNHGQMENDDLTWVAGAETRVCDYAIAHTHGANCYRRSCGHENSHSVDEGCYGVDWIVCPGDNHVHAETKLGSEMDLGNLANTEAYQQVISQYSEEAKETEGYQTAYQNAYNEATKNWPSWMPGKDAAGKAAGIAAQVKYISDYASEKAAKVLFCAVYDENDLTCTHVCNLEDYSSDCYSKICLYNYEHSHTDTCYEVTWTQVADLNNNEIDDTKETPWIVMFDVNGGKETIADQNVLDGLTAEAPADPTRDYYTFAGWSPALTTVIKNDTTFKAQWTITNDDNGNDVPDEEDVFTVKYVDVDGTPLKELTGLGIDDEIEKYTPTENQIPDHKTFGGWKGYSATVIAANDTDGDCIIEIVAIWNDVDQYTVTFMDRGSQYDQKTVYKDETVVVPTTPAWDNDHDFQGWYTDAGEQYVFSTPVTGNLTLAAKWMDDFNHNNTDDATEAHYTVTYTDGVNGAAFNDKVFENVLVGLATPEFGSTPVYENYTFVGWDPAFAQTVGGNDENIVYTATWIKDINGNEVKDSEETVSVVVTGNGAVTVNGASVKNGDKYVYDSTEVDTITVTTDAADGSYLVSVKIDDADTTSVATNGNHSVEVVFAEMSIFAQDGEMNYYIGMPEMTTDALIVAIKAATNEDATPDSIESGIKTEYLAREASEIQGEYITIPLPEVWLPVGTVISEDTNDISNLLYYGCHTFGKQEVETVRYSYTDGRETIRKTADVTLKDLRTPTTITGNDATVTYGAYTVAELKGQIAAAVNVDGATVDYSLDDAKLAALNAGTHKVTLKYTGNDNYKPSEKEITITVNKAPVTISVDNNVVKYGEAYDINVTTDPAVETIQFVLGLDVAEMHLDGDQKPTGWKTELNLMLPGELAKLLPGSDISMSQLMDLFESDLVKGAMNLLGISQETMDGLFATMENLQEQFGDLTITVNGELPTNIGAYVVGAVTADANYETKAAVGYLVITPDGYKAELDWIVPDENGIVTLPAIKDGSYDLGAYVTKVHEGTVEEAEKELVDLFLGVDMDGNIVVTNDQNDLTVGAYSEISYILNWGNTMYYAEPIARAFVVVAEPVNVQFVDENGVINGDRLFTFDGEPRALDVKIFDVNNNDITDKLDAKNLTVTYYGVRSNGETYNSTTAPTHTGAYTAVATYVEKGADGTIQRAGVDVAVMIIKPIADAIVAVDNDHHIYDGNAYDVMQLVKSTPADAKVAVFTCGINLAGDFSEEGLSALSGQANIDFPAAADTVLKKYLPEVYENGLTAATVNTKIAQVKAELEKLGMNSDTLDGLTKLLAELPEGMVLTFKEQADVNPAAVGAYLVVGMIFDPDYVPEFGAGVLVITPEVQEAYLKFNVEDDNGIFTHEKIANADLGASAYDDAAFTKKNTDATSLVKNLFIGVDAEGKLVKTDDGKTLSDGTYIQIAYIGELNGRYYAEPISRPMIVAMDVADVDILDGNGNENYAQVYTYGEEIQLTVTVDGKAAPVDGLTVMYIGSDTTVDGWYRDEVPADAGVYTVVAIYTEKDGSKLVKAGGAIGVLIIEPADVEVGLTDAEHVYDGNEYFATITNDTLDYVTVAIDRENNIAYVNMPEDTAEHVDRIITMLPAETEARLRTFLEKYESFDGDVQTSVLKEELTLIIDKMVGLDMTSEAEALAKQVADKVIADLEKNEDVNATIQQIKSELAAIEDAIRGEISDEIEASLEQYIHDIITVNGGIDVDVDQVKTEIKALIAEIEGQLPADAAAELDKLINELVAAVKNSMDVDELETEITQILNDLETLAADEAETLAKYVVGAIYSQVDMTEIESLLEQVVTKVEARGYVDYLKNMVNMIAGVYGGEIDTSSVESALNTLITKVEEKVASGKIDADDLEGLETYVDQVLVSLKSVVNQIPEGKVVFGKNPSDVGEYDCYAMNISANYKWEFVEATLIIYEETYTVSFDANGGTGTMDDVTSVAGTYTLPANGFTAPAGKQFKGWATAADGDVISGTTITVSANITLYAIWETSGAGGTGGGAGGGAGGAVGGGGGGAILDTQNHFSYMVGFADGTLQPYGNVTRGQVATIFFRLLTDEAREKYWSQTNNYSDCSENLWCNNAISTLSNMGIIDGYEDGTFRPYAKITRAQFAKIAVGFFETTKNDYQGYFSDVPANAWFSEYVEAAVNAGLIQGFQDGTYRPNDYITRAQACVIVNRALDRKPDMDYLLDEDEMITWTDCTPDHWFYADMMEATNSHDYEMVRVSGKTVENWTKKLEQRDWTALEKSWSTANSAPGGEVVR